MTRRMLVVAAAAVLAVATAAPHALAQDTTPPAEAAPRWFVGLGGASMHPLHGDNEPEGGVVLASIGFAATPRVRLEVEVSHRSRSTSSVTEQVFLYGGPNGIDGRADRVERGRETTDWTVGVNLVGRTGGRTVALFGGPGVVLHQEQSRDYRTVTGCTPPIPGSGAECRSFDDQSSSVGAGLQLMGGVDVAFNRRITAFVAGRAEYRAGLTMGGVGVMAGVRVGLR